MEHSFSLPTAVALALEERARLEGLSVEDVVNRLLLDQSLCAAEAAGLTDPRFDHGPLGRNRRLPGTPKFPH